MSSWSPTFIRRADRAIASATSAVRVTTDAGPGFLKALGNSGGPHLLVADLLGTALAKWFGLPTFEWAIIEVADDDEIDFADGSRARPGPAFITREQAGFVWGGGADELKRLVNPSDVARLVVFDTWVRNGDRYRAEPPPPRVNRNNVFLSTEGVGGGKARLIAMDHTHCLNEGRDLDGRMAHIDRVKDDRIYGLFPEFASLVRTHWATVEAAVVRLGEWDEDYLQLVQDQVPMEWELSAAAREAIRQFLSRRARHVGDSICEGIQKTLASEPDLYL